MIGGISFHVVYFRNGAFASNCFMRKKIYLIKIVRCVDIYSFFVPFPARFSSSDGCERVNQVEMIK